MIFNVVLKRLPHLAIWLILTTAGAAPFTPNVTIKNSQGKNGVQKVTRRILFDNARLDYITNTPTGKTRSLHHSWGDLVFGLHFGQASQKILGSWSPTRFLRIFIKPNPNSKPIQIELHSPQQIIAYQNDDTNYAEIMWDIPQSKNSLKVKLKMTQFLSHKKWLFFQISCKAPCVLSHYELYCYPGNAKWRKVRERMMTHQSASYNISKQSTNVRLNSPGLIFHNLYEDDDDANLAVLDDSQIESIKAPKALNGVAAVVNLKPAIKSTVFALGYVANSDNTDNDFRLFLEEKQDTIYTFMKSINWHVTPSHREFGDVIQDINDLLKSPLLYHSPSLPTWQAHKNKLIRNYQNLKKSNDSLAFINLLKQAQTLKQIIIKHGLSLNSFSL